MKYYVTNLRDIDYNLKNVFVVKAGKKMECTKEIYEYISKTYGDSGWFTFHKDHIKEPDEVKVAKDKESKTEQSEVKEPEVEIKIGRPKSKRKDRTSNKKPKVSKVQED